MMLSTPNGYCKEDKYGRLLDKKTISVDSNSTYPDDRSSGNDDEGDY